MKRCASCGVEKSLGEFYVRKDSPDGYRNDCKECRKSRSLQTYFGDVDRKKEQKREAYRKKVEANPGYHAALYWKNVERRRQSAREYYKKHREKIIEKSVAYASQNKAKANATKKRYKLAKKNACPPWVLRSLELRTQLEFFYQEAQRLTQETGVVHHVDHIIPVQGDTVCGLHVPWNLQILTASENCSKQNRVSGDAA